MEPYLPPLVLPQKSRLALQLGVSLLFVLVAIAAYFNLPDIMARFHGLPQSDEVALPVWAYIAMFVLALIPGALVFTTIRDRLDLDFSPIKISNM